MLHRVCDGPTLKNTTYLSIAMYEVYIHDGECCLYLPFFSHTWMHNDDLMWPGLNIDLLICSFFLNNVCKL